MNASADNRDLESEIKRVERLTATGRHTEAVGILNDLVSEHPRRVEPYFRRAMARDALRDRVGAVADLTAAIAINPAEPASFYFRGRWRVEDGDYSGAISDLRQAIAADEAEGSSYYAGSARLCLAVSYFLAKQFKQCELACRGISTDATTYLAGRLWTISDLVATRRA